MLHWGNGRVCPDGIGPRHVTYGFKRVCKGSFQDHNVWGLGYCMRGSHWGDCTSGQQRIGLGTLGRRPFARVGCLMVLEEDESGTWGDFKVLEWLKLPTLTSW